MSLTIEGVTQLITEAKENGCPFMESRNPSNLGIWSKRAARSTDIVILNRSKYNFKLADQCRSSGVWTENMLPVADIKSKRSVIYGCQSRGVMTGCTECTVTYKSTCGKAVFTVYTSNPYVGGPHAGMKSATNVTVQTNVGAQKNNLVTFTVA